MPIQIIKPKPEFIDDRGAITRLIDQDDFSIHSVLYITSKAGTKRANHYHKKDTHYIYCLSGKFKYSEKNMSDYHAKTETVILGSGDLVKSTPMIAHSLEFIEDTVFLAITTENRDQEAYENDTVRVDLPSA